MIQAEFSPPLSEPELEHLAALLGSEVFHGDAMWLDELQGFLCAVISGPQAVPPSVWLPVALGEAPAYENAEQCDELLSLVMRFNNDVACALQGDEGLALQLYRNENEDDDDYASWCCGYLEGTELMEVDWYEVGDPDEVDELLFPFMMLAGDPDEYMRESGQRSLSAREKDDLLEGCREDLADTVMQIYRYWRVRETASNTVRREATKTRRNDPCPCGSGKKFKQCCSGVSGPH